MARQVRDAKLETVEARTRLKQRREPHWRVIGDGLHLGYYKGARGAAWFVRYYDGNKYQKARIAEADDHRVSNEEDVLTFGQAQKRAFQISEEFQKPGGRSKDLTVDKAADRYLTWFKEHRKGYENTLSMVDAHIRPAFGSWLVRTLAAPDIRHWHENLASQPVRRRTKKGQRQAFEKKAVTDEAKRARKSSANRILTILKAILNRAFQDQLVADDSAWRRVKPFAQVDEPIIRFLSPAESSRMVNACSKELRSLVTAALLTGARYSELARMTAGALHIRNGTVFVTPSKSGKGRHISLSTEGIGFFSSVAVGKAGGELLFIKADGTPWGKNHQVRLLAEACIAAKINPAISFHELRHTYASQLAQAGVDLLTISKLLGHADTRITARHYAHLCDKTLADAVQKLPSLGLKFGTKVEAFR